MDVDIVVIISCCSMSNEYLVMLATQPKERAEHMRGGIVSCATNPAKHSLIMAIITFDSCVHTVTVQQAYENIRSP